MASYSRDDAITLVWRMLRDTGNTATEQLLTNTEIGQFVDQATRRYSRIRPLLVVEDVAADGTNFSDLPATFDVDFGRIVTIETPPGSTPPSFIDPRAYRLYLAPTGWKLLWVETYPSSGESVRYSYTTVRSFGAAAASTTVADNDFEAVASLAASYAALAIAGKYARTNEPIIAADNINYRTKTQEWTSIADKWRGVFEKHAAGIVEPGSTWVNWDSRLSVGYGHVTHPRYRR